MPRMRMLEVITGKLTGWRMKEANLNTNWGWRSSLRWTAINKINHYVNSNH